MHRILPALALSLLLPALPATAGTPLLAEARNEIRTEMAQARHELRTGDLTLGQGVSIGRHRAGRTGADLPEAVITPSGQFRIDGRTVPTSPVQQALLREYRQRVVEVGEAGIGVGERAALLTLEAIDAPLLSLIGSAMTGGLERKVERTVRRHLEPLAGEVCDRLPAVLASQDRLAAALPAFQPYASLDARDVRECRQEITQSLAKR